MVPSLSKNPLGILNSQILRFPPSLLLQQRSPSLSQNPLGPLNSQILRGAPDCPCWEHRPGDFLSCPVPALTSWTLTPLSRTVLSQFCLSPCLFSPMFPHGLRFPSSPRLRQFSPASTHRSCPSSDSSLDTIYTHPVSCFFVSS